jgi:KipI family sensor histidine kinase inhibitor
VTRVRRCGDRALLLEVDDVAGIVRALRALPPVGLVDVVAGAETVLVQHTDDTDVLALARLLTGLEPLPADPSTVGTVTLDVVYDGPDLADVAAATGMTSAEVVARHCGAEYEVAFCGFSPGFAYLRGLDPGLVVPRLATPRTVVPAGSVAVADTWSAVYPRDSPGGWQLLGRTDAVLWDLGRPAPALLTAGTRVRFVAVQP